ncbi:unnamed protein product [Calypogeia fissa]
MARRKQPRPTRPKRPNEEAASDEEEQSDRPAKRSRKLSFSEAEEVIWRYVLLPEMSSEDAKDVAEITLQVHTPTTGFAGLTQKEKEDATLRVRLQLPTERKVRVGGLQEVSKQDLRVQVLIYPKSAKTVANGEDRPTLEINQDSENFKVLISGEVDGPDAVIASLAYLIRLEYISLRPAPCLTCDSSCSLDHNLSGRLRVLISKKAFISSESLSKRSLWTRAMQTVVFWLRPEVARVRSSYKHDEEITENFGRLIEGTGCDRQHVFDPSALYDAVKPSWPGPVLDMSFPELLPNLRPYQLRAAFWMVHRERGLGARVGTHPSTSETGTDTTSNHQVPSTSAVSATARCFPDEHPLWFSVQPLDGSSEFFFNPYTGAVSLEPRDFVAYVKGGILADEMGLGKTVELLACILANPYKDLSATSAVEAARTLLQDKIASRKRERVECACGATNDDEYYRDPWVQCDVCDAWQHSTCVGIAPPAELSTKETTRAGKKWRIVDKEDKFFCGVCAEIIGSVEVIGDCKATLVVCPTPILQQWQDEIVRHTRPGSLRVIVYEGVKKGAFVVLDGKDVGSDNMGRLKVVSAHELAAADIVLTTYDILRTDLSHDSDKTKSNQRSLRYFKRYPVVPTPLTRLRWWRVCLDEAQMVEGSTTKATEMALLLDAQNRWCVSGTPIQRGLDDLFGLLRFLQAEPFDDYQSWNQVLRQPYEAGDAETVTYMHKFLGMLMWRSTKLLVKDELHLPPQDERLSWLRFSPVEAHFYRQQHEKCAAKAREMIAKYGRERKQHAFQNLGRSPVTQAANPVSTGTGELQTISLPVRIGPTESASAEQRNGSQIARAGSGGVGTEDRTSDSLINDLTNRQSDADRPLSRTESSILSTSLLRLRQACCHPQVGSAGIRSLQQRSPMTMDEILQVLVDKAKIEAEEAQRVLIGALNGLAALAAIDSNIPLAVSVYREALALTEENAADIDVDPLQKLHTLHNLADVLGLSSSDTCKEETLVNGGRDALKLTDAEVANSDGPPLSDGVSVLTSATEDHDTVGRENGKVSEPDRLTNIPVDDANSRTATGLSSSGVNGLPHSVAAVRLLGSKIPRTLRDDVLIKQCQEIRSKYMGSFHAKLAVALADFENANLQVSEAKKDCEASGGTSWWLEVLTTLEKRAGGGTDLANKIRSHLLETDNLGKRGRHQNASSLALLFREISGLKYLVQKELDALGSARDQVLERLNSLNLSMKNPTAQDAERIANCPRHSESTTGSLCAHCEMDDLFQIYENRLLLLRTSAAAADGLVTAEDAVIAQHRILAHRRINGSKDQLISGRSQSTEMDNDLVRNRRGATETEVLRAPSETEQILSIIKAQARIAAGVRDAATKHLHIFETMKKEYSQMRALAKIQREVLYALDELNMATTRLTLQLPGEVVENEIEKLVKLPAEEVPQRNVQLTSEKFDALKDFSRAKGQLRYLKGLSLARQQEEQRRRVSGSTGTLPGSHQGRPKPIEGWHHDEETCPVCHDKLGSQLMVLPCGHLLCCKCCMVMIERSPTPPNGNSRKCIPCPTCRKRTYVGDIAFVDNGSERNEIATQMGQLHEGAGADEEASLQVKGSYGTKIEAVVRRLLWVKKKDQDAKILIFSSWQEVLDVIEHALSVNKITFARVKGTKLNEPIKKFRGIPFHTAKSRHKRVKALDTDESVNVLLLPIERGGNGLNLVEAQHVILVEPSPNPAIEAQAINRVHRIGQTRATFVHRFIVNETVEESVYWLGRSKAELAEKFPGSGAGSRKRGRFALTLNDVSALFSSELPAEAEGTSVAAHQSNVSTLTPAAAAGAAAEARLRQQVASQQVIG